MAFEDFFRPSDFTQSLLSTSQTEALNINRPEDKGLLAQSIKIASEAVPTFRDESPEKQQEILKFISRDIKESKAKPTDPKKFNQVPNPVADRVIERLGVGSRNNLLKFAEIVKQVESDGKGNAKSPTSSAKGHFQYIDSSVQPAINRAKRFFKKETPEWLKELEKHKDVTRLSDQQATQLFLADISEKKGTDPLLKKAASGDTQAMTELYNRFHHTKPDSATKKRWNKILRKLG